MKKTRFLALTLVVAIMLMGAGYAFWMEEIVIGTTVNTGELDIAFSNESAFIAGGDYVTGNKTGHYVTGSATKNSTDDNKLDIVLNNMHPGSYAKFKFAMQNTGTIDLKVTDFLFVGNDNDNLEQLGVLTTGNIVVPVQQYLNTVNEISIAKDQKGYMEIIFAIMKCADDSNFNEDTDFGFSIKANVKQYNDDDSCDEGNDNPEIVSRKFVGNIVNQYGNVYDGTEVEEEEDVQLASYGGKKYFIKGTLTTTFDEGAPKVATVLEEIDYNQKTESVTVDGVNLVFGITWSGRDHKTPSDLSCSIQ